MKTPKLPPPTAPPPSAESSALATVVIPTLDGARYLRTTIEAILGQDVPAGRSLELLIIDSGSTDGTLEIIRGYGESIRLLEIDRREFGHGATRDRAARMARGEFVVFLTQDATPVHRRWLVNLLEPFFLSERVGCVHGGQRPRADAVATIKREVTERFDGRPETIVIDRAQSLVDGAHEFSIDTFLSDVNSAARRSLLIGPVPIRHVAYAEDQALAKDMQVAGFLKAYAPHGDVWHSNEFTVAQFLHRKRDEYLGAARSAGRSLEDGELSLLTGWIRPTVRDWWFIARDRDYAAAAKVEQFLKAPLYNAAAKVARYRAAREWQQAANSGDDVE